MDLLKERGRPTSTRFGPDKQMVTSTTMNIFEQVFRIFEQLCRGAGRHRNDFRVALLKTNIRQRRDFGSSISKLQLSLNFWCLNPAVTFSVRQIGLLIILCRPLLFDSMEWSVYLGFAVVSPKHYFNIGYIISNSVFPV